MSEPLLNAQEVSAMLGIKHSQWAKWKKRGLVRQFEVPRPMSPGVQRRYVKELVARYLRGESTTRIGSGSRVAGGMR